jgi:hypothetical protein
VVKNLSPMSRKVGRAWRRRNTPMRRRMTSVVRPDTEARKR